MIFSYTKVENRLKEGYRMTEQNRSAIDQGRNSAKRGIEATGDAAKNAVDAVEDAGKAVVDRISNAVKDVTAR